MERVTRLELATSSLARRCSTTELHPHFERVRIMSTASASARAFVVGETLRGRGIGYPGPRNIVLPRGNFLESKSPTRCISLPKDNYEKNVSYLPMFDRAWA